MSPLIQMVHCSWCSYSSPLTPKQNRQSKEEHQSLYLTCGSGFAPSCLQQGHDHMSASSSDSLLFPPSASWWWKQHDYRWVQTVSAAQTTISVLCGKSKLPERFLVAGPISSSMSSSPGTTALVRQVLFWQMHLEGISLTPGTKSRMGS